MRGFTWRAGLVVLLGLTLTGCFGGSPPADQPQSTDEIPTATPLPAVIPTRSVTLEPTLGPSPTPAPPQPSGAGTTFESPLYNYTITDPRDWKVGPGAGKIGAIASDLYTGPTVDGVPTTVDILAQNLPSASTDTPAFFRANVAALQSVGTTLNVRGSVPVGTSRATLLIYRAKLPNGDQSVNVHQVTFVMANRGWVLRLTTAPRATEAGLADFKLMLQSFRPK